MTSNYQSIIDSITTDTQAYAEINKVLGDKSLSQAQQLDEWNNLLIPIANKLYDQGDQNISNYLSEIDNQAGTAINNQESQQNYDWYKQYALLGVGSFLGLVVGFRILKSAF